MQKITPCLWFDDQAEEAIKFYTTLFADSKVVQLQRYPDDPPPGPMENMQGKILTGIFELAGQRFMALDGGPVFKINPSISFFVHCGTKKQVDSFWAALSAGGEALMPLAEYPFNPWYGWIQDRFGVSWQLILAPAAQEIVPSLLFVGDQAGNAEQAIQHYAQVFEGASIGEISRYGPGQEPDQEGTVAHATFKLENQTFAAMDSAQQHEFGFNEAVSFYVECRTQEELDRFWKALSAVPEAEQCGWLKDKFGVSWQIVPVQLGEMLSDPDPERSGAVMEAMLKMKKFDIAALEAAYGNG
jgi:predicted 3-demethylubiquinone-9 3-methyltransferase (glyoxalase superfamily)